MKVQQLINRLKDCDPNAYVVVHQEGSTYSGWINVEAIYVQENNPGNQNDPEEWEFTQINSKDGKQQVIAIG